MFKKRKSYSRTIVLDSVTNEKKAHINILEGCLFLSERLINKHYFQSLRESLIINIWIKLFFNQFNPQ